MRMRQSLAEIEEAFVDEIEEDRHRRERLRAAGRAAHPRAGAPSGPAGRARPASGRSWLTLIATAVIVTIVMFRVLYIVMG